MSKHPLADCENCPLIDRPICPSSIPPNADVALVSRSPGIHDATVGRPFAGRSGEVLDHLLKQNGVSRNDILVTNVVLCSPKAGKVPPEAIKACSGRLKSELEHSSLIIAAGSEAVNLLIGRGAIDYYRGYRIRRGSRTFVATNNPALVLRDDSTFPNLVKDFRRAFNPLPAPQFPTVRIIDVCDEARKAIVDMSKHTGLISADIESRGGLTHKAKLVCIGFSASGSKAVVFGESVCRDEKFLAELGTFLESTDRHYIWHNGKFDVKILRNYGIQARVDHDTLLMSYCLDERPGYHSLDYCLMENFGWPNYEPKSVKEFKKTGELKFPSELYKYNGWDTAGTMQLFNRFTELMHEQGMESVPTTA